MARILAIDYGKKRTGLAASDPMQIIATAIGTVETKELIGYLKNYIKENEVEKVLIGYPLNLDDSPTDATPLVDKFIGKYKNVFPDLEIEKVDETLTSKMASLAMVEMGMKKKDRQKKENVDTVAATIILQEYLQSRH